GYARPDSPGQAWAYNDYGVALFQRTLFDRVYREDPSAVLNHPRRLGALGFEDEPRFSQRRRRLRASARDFARIAWFWLHRGRWDGRELIAAERFSEAFRPHVPSDLPHGQRGRRDDYLGVESFGGTADHFTQAGPGTYGWFWWFNETGRIHPQARLWPSAPPDTVMSIGGRGNCAALFPSLNAVVVAARANWGSLEPGRAGGQLDRTLALAAEALRREGARGAAAGPGTSQQP
ncbi:MAG TPA: hypothetical protein VMK65_01695, partial [Longimicrobiales bacterium]|nr:hypothetical protein [Longimicrobiales bacterium]